MHSESNSITTTIEPYKLRIVKNQKISTWFDIVEVTILIYKNTININSHDYYSYNGFICFKQDRDYFTAQSPYYNDQKLIELLIKNEILEFNDHKIYLTNAVLLKLL